MDDLQSPDSLTPAKAAGKTLMPLEAIAHRIVVVRGQKVLLDTDLAAMYGVVTGRFNEQVKRNLQRFPADFMFQIDEEEFAGLLSQFAMSNHRTAKRGGRRSLPYAFTEHGAIMAATILNSQRATQVAVYVVRAFIQLRELIGSNQELALRLNDLETKAELMAQRHDSLAHSTHTDLKRIFDALRDLMASPPPPARRPIGFVTPEETPPKPRSPGAHR